MGLYIITSTFELAIIGISIFRYFKPKGKKNNTLRCIPMI
jgi:hypothetical protein